MKSNNNIYTFFITTALLFWNPLSFYFLYSNTPLYSAKIVHLFYWLAFVSGIILIILLQKNRLGKNLKNIIFSVAFASILFASLVLLNVLIGLFINNSEVSVQKKEGLIFEPNSKARYQTIEFDYLAEINSIGLRDREISIEKGEKYRILCFGDSWTFGWGVDIENSWPRKLEQYLHKKGFNNVEVINCGQGGQYTSTYKKFIEKSLPLLKPDLVLLGVLQLDDLAQLYENNNLSLHYHHSVERITLWEKIKYVVKSYLKHSFNNLLFLSKNSNKSNTVEIKSNWQISSTAKIESFNHLQTIRFYTLDDSVQSLFKSGNLNPGLLGYYIDFPDRVTIFNNPNHPATKFSIQEMHKDVKEIRTICEKHNSKLTFINLPINFFTDHIVIRTPSDVLNSYFATNNNIDSIYRYIATVNNVSYIELTNHFIGLQNKSEYFFKYDGHPNEKGYEEIAKYIGKQLIVNNKFKKE